MAFSPSVPSTSSHSLPPSLRSTFLRPLPIPCHPSPAGTTSTAPPCSCRCANAPLPMTRRSMAVLLGGFALTAAQAARADIEEEYKKETEEVIARVRTTLNLDKADPGRGDAVKALRETSNQWVAKYRREKRFAGKPSYSNIYSVLNAVSGHYISYGDGAPLPPKRKTLILDEVDSAERSLNRGR